MTHQCGQNCTCRDDLDEAAVGLAEASRLLSHSISFDSEDLIENCWARVRAAKAKVQGARAIYIEHRRDVVSCR